MTAWQTGGLAGEVAGLDGEQSREVADLEGIVVARLETMWQIWTYGVLSQEVVDQRASRRCGRPGWRSCGKIGVGVVDLGVEVAARLGTRWQAGDVEDLSGEHGVEEVDLGHCNLDGEVAVLDGGLRR